MTDVKWLTPLEKKIYDGLMLVVDVSLADKELVDVFNNLAACRALLEDARDYIEDDGSGMSLDATGNGIIKRIATALQGVGGER